MSAATWRNGAIVIIGGLLLVIVALLLRPQPRIPRIVDEHGNNLVYQCPGDPRCNPTPVTLRQ